VYPSRACDLCHIISDPKLPKDATYLGYWNIRNALWWCNFPSHFFFVESAKELQWYNRVDKSPISDPGRHTIEHEGSHNLQDDATSIVKATGTRIQGNVFAGSPVRTPADLTKLGMNLDIYDKVNNKNKTWENNRERWVTIKGKSGDLQLAHYIPGYNTGKKYFLSMGDYLDTSDIFDKLIELEEKCKHRRLMARPKTHTIVLEALL